MKERAGSSEARGFAFVTPSHPTLELELRELLSHPLVGNTDSLRELLSHPLVGNTYSLREMLSHPL